MVLLLFIVGVAAWLVGWRWFDASGTVTLALVAASVAATALELILVRGDSRQQLLRGDPRKELR